MHFYCDYVYPQWNDEAIRRLLAARTLLLFVPTSYPKGQTDRHYSGLRAGVHDTGRWAVLTRALMESRKCVTVEKSRDCWGVNEWKAPVRNSLSPLRVPTSPFMESEWLNVARIVSYIRPERNGGRERSSLYCPGWERGSKNESICWKGYRLWYFMPVLHPLRLISDPISGPN